MGYLESTFMQCEQHVEISKCVCSVFGGLIGLSWLLFFNRSREPLRKRKSMHMRLRRIWWKRCWAAFERWLHFAVRKGKSNATIDCWCQRKRQAYARDCHRASARGLCDFCSLPAMHWLIGMACVWCWTTETKSTKNTHRLYWWL